MDIKENLVQEDSKIIEAMKIIEINSAKIAFVINKKNKLLGTVTDGDIRRSFLKGFNKNSSISEIMNKKYHYVNERQSIDEALCEMKKKSIKCNSRKSRYLINLILKYTRINTFLFEIL